MPKVLGYVTKEFKRLFRELLLVSRDKSIPLDLNLVFFVIYDSSYVTVKLVNVICCRWAATARITWSCHKKITCFSFNMLKAILTKIDSVSNSANPNAFESHP